MPLDCTSALSQTYVVVVACACLTGLHVQQWGKIHGCDTKRKDARYGSTLSLWLTAVATATAVSSSVAHRRSGDCYQPKDSLITQDSDLLRTQRGANIQAIGKTENSMGKVSLPECVPVEVRLPRKLVAPEPRRDILTLAHGTGVCETADGERYSGEYAAGLPHGKGTYRFKNGNIYEGEYKEGKICGYGTIRFPDNRRFEGVLMCVAWWMTADLSGWQEKSS